VQERIVAAALGMLATITDAICGSNIAKEIAKDVLRDSSIDRMINRFKQEVLKWKGEMTS